MYDVENLGWINMNLLRNHVLFQLFILGFGAILSG
ncbi:hypothetical protein HRbin01_01735 [archaeon HR01]|nr:hypothetical protein HRbin01_01735 [archaeon HR01]